jgi:hypothetical protein
MTLNAVAVTKNGKTIHDGNSGTEDEGVRLRFDVELGVRFGVREGEGVEVSIVKLTVEEPFM